MHTFVILFIIIKLLLCLIDSTDQRTLKQSHIRLVIVCLRKRNCHLSYYDFHINFSVYIVFISYLHHIYIVFISYSYHIHIIFISYSHHIHIVFISYSYRIHIVFISYLHRIYMVFISYLYNTY